jgi:alkylated DNA repair protein (DNA oxidative demethylase)
MLSLFDAPIVPGFSAKEAFVSATEEAELIGHIEAENLSPFRFHQWTGKRQTCSFGWSYDFENGSFGSAESLPAWLQSIKVRAAAFAGLTPEDLVQALLIRYDPGAGIGWHKDRPVFEHVVGISLGSAATLRLRRRRPAGFDRTHAELAPRSIYHLSNEVRHQWEHSIAPMETPRWSVTFRSLSAAGRGHG